MSCVFLRACSRVRLESLPCAITSAAFFVGCGMYQAAISASPPRAGKRTSLYASWKRAGVSAASICRFGFAITRTTASARPR